MNEINFEIQDIKKIDLSMDVGVKEIFPPIENLEVNPSKEQQVFNHENSYGYDEVIVNPIPDEYIIPDGTLDVNVNGDVDVTMFRMARVGVYTPPNLQDKELTINENGTHSIKADEGYDGLNQLDVTVEIEGKEDLTEELNTYNTELTEQETKIADVIELLQTKATPSGEKYAPRWIRFSNYKGTDLDYELANLDTKNMTTLASLFSSCSDITSMVFDGYDTSNVTSMQNMFSNCSSIKNIELNNLDISNVTDVTYMFYGCDALNTVVFNNVDTSKITDMQYMFYYCEKTASLVIRGLNTSNVTNMQYMFNNCKALQLLDIREFDFTKVTSYSRMFDGVPSSCVIVVKDYTAKSWINNKFANRTVRTVEEYGG